MQITVSTPKFDSLFKIKLGRAKSKGTVAMISGDSNVITIKVVNSVLYNKISRILGLYEFEIDGDTCILIKKHTIERDYCPFEMAIFSLTKHLKRKKVKYIVWD